MTMRIGIDARMYGSAQTGIGIYIEQLTNALFRIDDKNEYILFLRGQLLLPGLSASRVRVVPATPRWYSPGEQALLPFVFLREKLDLLFVPHFNAPVWYPGKFVVTMHDVTPLDFPARGAMPPWWRRMLFRMVAGNAVRRAAAVIAVSQFTKNETVRRFHVPEKKIKVIPEAPRFSKAAVLDPHLLSTIYHLQMPYVLFVGVLRPHKNILGLLEAFSLLRKRSPDVTLVLAGPEDPRYPEIRRRAHAPDIRGFVKILGFVPDEDLPQLLVNAACVVVPSFIEGFGLVGLEALVQRVPVAASLAGALPEVLGDAASYFDPKNPEDMAQVIAGVLHNHGLRARMRAHAEKILARFSWEQTARATLAVLQLVSKS